MRGDEEIAKAVEESLMAEGARGRRPEDDKDDSLEGSRGNGDNPCGASNGQRRSSCEEVADHLFELLDAQMPLEAAARLRRHCETCPHCSELAEAEIHVREIVKRSCCSEPAPVSLRVRVTNQIAVYRSTTA